MSIRKMKIRHCANWLKQEWVPIRFAYLTVNGKPILIAQYRKNVMKGV